MSHPRRRADIRFERMPDGSAVLFDPATSMTYAITSSAVLIWEACDGSRPSSVIGDDLAETYDAPRDVIDRDVDALLAHFAELGLLEPGGGSAP